MSPALTAPVKLPMVTALRHWLRHTLESKHFLASAVMLYN